jgi:hypothetical protein
MASWPDQRGHTWTLIYLYWPPKTEFDTYVGRHNPEGCFGGTGWTLLNRFQTVTVHGDDFSMVFTHRLFEQAGKTMHVFHGTWEPFVPSSGQTLFYDSNYYSGLKSYIRHALERRRIFGGTTLEMGLSGPSTEEDANRLFQEQMAQLIAVNH